MWYNTIAAVPNEKNETTPETMPNRVVWSTVNPNELMMREYWLVNPLAISCDHACRKKSHVLGSCRASMNLLIC